MDATELGTDLWRRCFAYPEQVSGRRHGPRGYAHYEGYRDWLRDEFSYRCAYCLMREPWLRGPLGFQIDHCIPQGQYPVGRLDYGNLVYTCPWCNQAKAGVAVPNPTEVAYGTALHVNEDGIIAAKNELGLVLLEGLKLDHSELTYQRRLVLRVVRLAARGHTFEWADVLADLERLQQVEVAHDGKRFLLRSEVQGTCGQVCQAVGVALPPTVQQLPE